MLGGVLHDESFISSCQQPGAAPLPAHAPIALEASGALWFPACRSLGISAQINSRPRSPGHLPVMAEESVAPAPPPAEPAKPQKKRPDKFIITGLHYVAWSPTGLHWRLRSECLVDFTSVECVGSFPHPVLCPCPFISVGTARYAKKVGRRSFWSEKHHDTTDAPILRQSSIVSRYPQPTAKHRASRAELQPVVYLWLAVMHQICGSADPSRLFILAGGHRTGS